VGEIEYLIFDLGHVLVDVTFEHGDRALARLALEHGQGMSPVDPDDGAEHRELDGLDLGAKAVEEFRHCGAYQEFMTGRMEPPRFFEVFCEVARIPSGAVTLTEFKAAWMEYLIGPQKGMGDILDRLARSHGEGIGPGLAILSNTDIWHWQACEEMVPGIAHVEPSRRFASCDLGLAKPDPAIYAAVAQRLGVSPARCVMIDDLERNLDGANQVGMEGLLFQQAGKLADDLVQLGLM